MSKSKKRVFLLEKANYVPMKDGQGEYDKRKSLNVVKNDKNNYVPVLSLNDAPPLNLKRK